MASITEGPKLKTGGVILSQPLLVSQIVPLTLEAFEPRQKSAITIIFRANSGFDLWNYKIYILGFLSPRGRRVRCAAVSKIEGEVSRQGFAKCGPFSDFVISERARFGRQYGIPGFQKAQSRNGGLTFFFIISFTDKFFTMCFYMVAYVT